MKVQKLNWLEKNYKLCIFFFFLWWILLIVGSFETWMMIFIQISIPENYLKQYFKNIFSICFKLTKFYQVHEILHFMLLISVFMSAGGVPELIFTGAQRSTWWSRKTGSGHFPKYSFLQNSPTNFAATSLFLQFLSAFLRVKVLCSPENSGKQLKDGERWLAKWTDHPGTMYREGGKCCFCLGVSAEIELVLERKRSLTCWQRRAKIEKSD